MCFTQCGFEEAASIGAAGAKFHDRRKQADYQLEDGQGCEDAVSAREFIVSIEETLDAMERMLRPPAVAQFREAVARYARDVRQWIVLAQ
jgi:hypothetical protein